LPQNVDRRIDANSWRGPTKPLIRSRRSIVRRESRQATSRSPTLPPRSERANAAIKIDAVALVTNGVIRDSSNRCASRANAVSKRVRRESAKSAELFNTNSIGTFRRMATSNRSAVRMTPFAKRRPKGRKCRVIQMRAIRALRLHSYRVAYKQQDQPPSSAIEPRDREHRCSDERAPHLQLHASRITASRSFGAGRSVAMTGIIITIVFWTSERRRCRSNRFDSTSSRHQRKRYGLYYQRIRTTTRVS